jgi:oxygen-dependent protoporphyrinogen oxidase
MGGVARRYAVVGGGIAGLAAAHKLHELDPGARVILLERGARLGGKIHTEPFVGRPIETGAETFLLREGGQESAALALARRLGLGDALVHPAAVPAALAVQRELCPVPVGTLMGIPADPQRVARLAPVVAGRDVDEGRPLLAPGEDVAVGELVRARLGDPVVDRLVDPLLGGVYAGRADRLSLQATVPGLHRTAATEHTLAGAVRAAMAAAPRPDGSPIFASLHGGLSVLVSAVARACGADVRLGRTARALRPAADRWQLTVGATTDESTVEADAVVLAVPAAPAARLLAPVAEPAATALAELEYASIVLVTLALPAETTLPDLSGFLVPAAEGYAVKAATFFTTKWPHLAQPRGGPVVVRASLGRFGDTRVLQRTDDDLVDLVRAELSQLLGTRLPEPVASRVNRWGGALPQYGVGHVARTASVRSSLPPTLALAGAVADGVGIAACVRSGEAAATRVWSALGG